MNKFSEGQLVKFLGVKYTIIAKVDVMMQNHFMATVMKSNYPNIKENEQKLFDVNMFEPVLAQFISKSPQRNKSQPITHEGLTMDELYANAINKQSTMKELSTRYHDNRAKMITNDPNCEVRHNNWFN
jgi:hypothetical protein